MVLGVSVTVAIGSGIWLWVARSMPPPRGGAVAEHRADRGAELCSGRNAVGVGLRGEYFRDPSMRGEPVLTRLDPVIDFASGLELPSSLGGQAIGSVRWSGWVKAPLTGRYRFHLDVPGSRLTVSQRAVSGNQADDAIELSAGRFYPILVELQGLNAAALPGLRLEWTAPHGARYLIPRALLHQPTETARS
jgi:PA14 domain